MRNRDVFIGAAFLLAMSNAAMADTGQVSGSNPCSSENQELWSCLALLEKAQMQLQARIDNLPDDSAEKILIEERKAPVDNAVTTLRDFAKRSETLTDVEKRKAAAIERREASSDPAIRAYENMLVNELTQQADALTAEVETARAAGFRYAQLAQGQRVVVTDLAASADGKTTPEILDGCRSMVADPAIELDVGSCQVLAPELANQSVIPRELPGADVKIPGSVLTPLGLTALLEGAESGGEVSLSFSDSWNFRRFGARSRGAENPLVQQAGYFSASVGLKAGDGTLFKRNTSLDTADQIGSKAALTASLSANFYSSERRKVWQARAEKVSADAVKACEKARSLASNSSPTDCQGLSLTNWVYARDDKGKLVNEDIANQVTALYFSGRKPIPRWGVGVNVELGRSSHEYLLPDLFLANFAGKFDDAFKESALQRQSEWVSEVSPYAFVRLTPADSKFGISLIPSYSIAKTLGYSSSYQKPLFCPGISADTPFTTSDCARFNGKEPDLQTVETIALEMRAAFPEWGGVNLIASPKVSWNDKDRLKDQPWLLTFPILAFTDAEKTSAVGFRIDWASGKEDAEGLDQDDDVSVKLIYQKSFNLTGK